ncbi:MAG: phosphoribosylformylglycinamidine cyclo-ligase [Actinobacteria bacterium]|nr:phosphoribosylformylglycinamidine cyclo-ligase [Actinomycetota bacterium]
MGGEGSFRSVSYSYKEAGVDIDAGNRAVDLIKEKVRSTFGPQVLTGIGGFGSLFALGGYKEPVLVASADGVGTKLKIAIAMDRHDTVGVDLVNHCVNDILTCGATPLFFLDYVAMAKLYPEKIAQLVGGLADACRANGCALVGGETAEMPGIYTGDDYDLAGFIVGAVERGQVVDGSRIQAGDLVWGLPSSGLHTNGYSLVRQVLKGQPLDRYWPELGRTLGDELLQTHHSYLKAVQRLRVEVDIRGMAHITGGGIPGNVSRIIPAGKRAVFHWGAWSVPPIFTTIQQRGTIPTAEMLRVFNMGLGFVFVCPPADTENVRRLAPQALQVGEIVAGGGRDRVEVLGAG